MPTEADTCRTLITPKLQGAGWEHEPAATGLQQAKDYAEILQLKFAYATNGIDIIEFDYLTGLERRIPSFPTPADLWSRLRTAESLTDDTAAQRLLTPANLTTGKEPRYYQRIAEIMGNIRKLLAGSVKPRDPRP